MQVRKADPWTVHLVWDAIQSCSSQRQQPNFERVSKFIMRTSTLSPEEIEEELNRVMEDGLVRFVQRLGAKGAKKGEEQELYKLPKETPEASGHDWYCSTCHRPGEVRGCSSCTAAFHPSCLSEAERDVVPLVCALCQESMTEKSDMKKKTLNTLLGYTCMRLKARMLPLSVSAGVLCPSADPELKFRAEQLLHRRLEMFDIEDKLDRQVYQKLTDFQIDIRLAVHNIILMNGPESEASTIAALVVQDCAYDLQQIRICRHCYRMSNEKRGKTWFCKPCRPPHELVFAKQKGYPYWPAKVMHVDNDMYDVRFFGEPHERANVPRNMIKPISTNLGSMQIKRSAPWNRAYDELKRHQTQLKEVEKNPALLDSDTESVHSEEPEEEKPSTGTPAPPRGEQGRTTPASKRRRRPFDSEEDGLVEVKDCSIVVQKVVNDKNTSLPSPDDQVSSSCQEPQPRTVAVQTPAKFLRAAAAEHTQPGGAALEERVRSLQRELDRARQTHKQELAAQAAQHAQALAASKRRQWCFNCEQEAIYHCCWNTAYCSTECQQSHWHKEHKRVCRRKRTV